MRKRFPLISVLFILFALLGKGAHASVASCAENIFTDGFDGAILPCRTSDMFFDDSAVREIHLTFSDPNWFTTLQNSHANDPTDPAFPASFESSGINIAQVGVRMKGNSSFFFGGIDHPKKSFKIDFDYYDPPSTPSNLETRFYELKKLNLNNSSFDPSMLREKLFLDFAGKYIPTPRAVHCRLFINGSYYGIYTAVEQVDKTFLKSRFPGGSDGNLWKGAAPDGNMDPVADFGSDLTWLGNTPTPYFAHYQLKTNETANDFSQLIQLTDVLNNTPSASLPAQIELIVDVPNILKGLAVSNVFSHLDSYTGAAHNYYLYDRSDNGKMTHILWDANMAFGLFPMNGTIDPIPLSPFWVGLSGEPRPLATNLWAVPAYNRRYLRDIAQMLRQGFDTTSMQTEIDRLADLIRTDVYADPNKFFTNELFDTSLYGELEDNPWGLRNFVTQRAAFLNTQLNAFANQSDIQLNELMTVNTATVKDNVGEFAPWVELYNLGPGQVDLSGLFLTDSVDNPTKWPLPAVNLDDGQFFTIWMDGQTAQGINHTNFTLQPGGGTLFLFQNASTLIDSITYPALSANTTIARLPDGEGAWAQTNQPTPAAANQASIIVGPPPVLFINELMADNTATIADPDEPGAFEDWIEIYNPGSTPVSLAGLHLTDTLATPTKWTFPAGVTIAAHGYLLVWADDEAAQGPTHASFKLSASGEAVGLYATDGTTAIDTITFGAQTSNISYGRSADGAGTWGSRSISTPGATNVP